jgi:hypothetical protein
VDAAGRAVNVAWQRRRPLAALAAALALTAAAQACSSRAGQGWTASTTSSSDSGIPGHHVTSTVRTRVLKDKIRLTITGTGAAAFGNYTIIDSAAGTVTNVYPKSKLALITGANPLAGGSEPSITMAAHVNPGYTVEDLGGGEPVLGHATRRYREKLAYDILITAGGDSCTRHIREMTELWVTLDSAIPDMEIAFKHIAAMSGSMVVSDVAKKLADVRGVRIKGVVLRRVSASNNPLAPDDSLTVHTRSEVTELKRGAIDASEFEIPSGYKVRDTRTMTVGLDSSARRAAQVGGGRLFLKRMCGRERT